MRIKLIFFIVLSLLFTLDILSQVGIGTTTPNAKAALEVKSTDKGVLFPRLTSAQRNAITNPPNGLHVYNTDESCLNYYDSLLTIWNCYCENDTCKVVAIKITTNVDTIDFYQVYARNYPNTKKFVVIINSGVVIKGAIRTASLVVRPGISFSSMPGNATVKIINNGNIYGFGGIGGMGASGDGASGTCPDAILSATNGTIGGNAFETNSVVKLSIENYGLIAGGAGGGGGGGRTSVGTQFGGGGGGGASFGNGGKAGWDYGSVCFPIGCICQEVAQAQAGTDGSLTTGGNGGNGVNGGGNGGKGGALGQPGQNGFGTAAGIGGAIGKAVSGGIGNSLLNISGGISYGAVD